MRHNVRKLWGVVLVLCLLLPTAAGATAIGPEQIGARAALADGNLTLTKMLTYALQDEYLARAEYRVVMETFGDRRPFSNIIQAEDQHIAMLTPLLNQYGVPLPTDAYTFSAPDTFQAALQAGVQAEKENIAMYELFLRQELPVPVRQVFTHLRDASYNHLGAFERNLGK